MIERLFAVRAHGSTVRREIAAGVTTFLTMAYIVVVNPAILSQAGMPIAAVAAATCLSAAFASILMGLFANVPIALAPGMGLNAYFTFTVVNGMGVPWETALGCVFLSGAVFLLLTLAGVRQLILAAIPRPLIAGTAAGIGLFIAFIGLKEAGIIAANPVTFVALGDLSKPEALLAIAGLAVIAGLQAWRAPGAILIGIVAAALGAGALGLIHEPAGGFAAPDLSATFLKADIPAALNLGGGLGVALIEIIFVFLFVDIFDNVGTLAAVTKQAGLVAPDGSIPRLKKMLLTDSVAAMFGAAVGTTTVTSYIESAAGVSAGGRTGLTSVVVGLLFLLALVFTPLVQALPTAVAAPALVLVGALMMKHLGDVAWDDAGAAIPAFLTLITIPLTFSIANGLAFGVIAYAALKLISGKLAWRSDWLLLVLAALFIARFAYLAAA
ncbi:MAG: NCS2 family permease [Hyphomonadaceae bacterium]